VKLNTRLSALALVSALALAGCGDDTKDDDAKAGDSGSSETASATDPTDATDAPETDDDSDDVSAGETVDKQEFLEDYRDGVEQLTTARLEMTMDLMGEKATGKGEIDYTGSSPEMAMTLSGSQSMGGDMEMRMLDGIMYMKTAQSGGKFLKLDLAALAEQMGPGMGDMFKNMDPVSSFELYADALTKVTYLGEDEHDGADLEHYETVIDTTKVEAFKNLPSSANIPKTLTSEMWLDDENRLVGYTSDIPSAGTVEMWLSDFDTDVTIEAPPASQVTTMPGMTG
jgi:hypothetical protein